MRRAQSTLYSLSLPALALLPVMEFSFSQIPDYLRGAEFRNLAGEFIIQVVTGTADALIIGLITLLFGAAA